jgi:glycosyltransferase involved in cell wall biosynthesis
LKRFKIYDVYCQFRPVSVIIPCFRCESTIRRAIDSVVRQTYPAAEIILVDDDSGDGTIDILNQYGEKYPGQVKVVSLSKNKGAGSARNIGWAIATQSYIAFLDADDSWHVDKLRIQCAHMMSNPKTILCGHKWTMVAAGEGVRDLSQGWAFTQISPHLALFKNPFATSTIMVTRDLPFRFEEGMRNAEDLLLWLRILFAGFTAARLEIPLGFVYKPLYGSGGLSRDLWKMERGELACLENLFREGLLSRSLFYLSALFSVLKYLKRLVSVSISRRLVKVPLENIGSN